MANEQVKVLREHNPDAGAYAKRESYGAIFSSTILIGGASILRSLSVLVRMKVAATLLGAAGVGLIGLLTAMIAAASTVVQLGMEVVGTQQIAQAHASGDEERVSLSRRALFLATIALSLMGAVSIWLFRVPLANWALGSADHQMLILAVAISVGLTVASTAQTALLQGMRRIRDLALLSLLSASTSTFVGVLLLRVYGDRAIPFFVIATPASAFVIGLLIVAWVPQPPRTSFNMTALIPHWMIYVRLGTPYMAASFAQTCAELLIRIDIRTQLGLEMLGQFQASWSVAYQIIGFALGAMVADYYPRLTASMSRPEEAVNLINQESEMVLLLCGPIMLAMFGWAPEIIALLYSSHFSEAGDLLRWQASAQPLKALSWTLGFILLAGGRGNLYFITELIFFSIMVILTHFLLALNLTGAGVAYLLVFVLNLPVIYFIARQQLSFTWSREVLEITAILALCFMVLLGVRLMSPQWTVLATFAVVAGFSSFTAARVHRMGLTRLMFRPFLPRRQSSRPSGNS